MTDQIKYFLKEDIDQNISDEKSVQSDYSFVGI